MISPAQWAVFRSGVSTVVGQAWAKVLPTFAEKFATRIPSDSTQEVHAWTGKLPTMRQWLGQRVTIEVAPATYVLVNQAFEATLGFDLFDLDDDKMGVYYRALPDMAEQAKYQPDYMFRDLLENTGDQTGSRQNGLDGLAGFSTAHYTDPYNTAGTGLTYGGVSYSTYTNDTTGGGASVTVPKANGTTTTLTVGGAFGPTALFTIWSYMAKLRGEDGEPFGILPNDVMLSTYLRGEGELVLRSSFFAPPQWGQIGPGSGSNATQVGAADNPLNRYGLNMHVNPLLNQAFTYYVMATQRAFKPFIHQVREATQMVPRINPNDPVVFSNHQVLFGMWDRQAFGWGPPWLVHRSGP